MRFFLVYKYGILQTKTERIDVNKCQNTTELINYIQKRVHFNGSLFIVRSRRAKNNFRIIKGWSLEHYQLKEGTQLHIEMIQNDLIQKESQNMRINNRYLTNILGVNQQKIEQIQIVKEVDNDDDDDENGCEFNMRKYLDQECEKMLKIIQKKNLVNFSNIFKQYPSNLDDNVGLQIQQKKKHIINELGQKGWGALHCAIFCGALDIFNELLEMGVDINLCTSDGWLPIQLAIDVKEKNMIQKLLSHANINLNLITIRGSPLHTAAKVSNQQILMMLLQKDVDIHLKDKNNQSALDVCLDPSCLNLMKKHEQKKYIYNQSVKSNVSLALATIVRGNVIKLKKPFMIMKQRYLLIDPFQGSMIIYETVADYPKKPKQIITLINFGKLHILSEKQRAWHMKKQFIYLEIQEPSKEIYAFKFRQTAVKWMNNIQNAVKFAKQVENSPQMMTEIKMKQQLIIKDNEVDSDFMSANKVKSIPSSAINATLQNSITTSGQNIQFQKKYDGINKFSSLENTKIQKKSIKQIKDNNQINQQQKNQKSEVKIEEQKNITQNKVQRLSYQLNHIIDDKIKFSSFNIIKTLGSGAFGRVFLVKHISTGQFYALKALKKKNLILQKQLKYAVIEANILKQANHPFIVNLHFAFQTPQYLYLTLDYCPGRDLSFHLAREVNFPEHEAAFYIAELLLAIEHLHSKKIIYRDLKPENILLDDKGHIRLADFGLSKQTNDDRTKSFCGSPAYLSPEMLLQKGAGKESDLYGIGAVLYEFIIGQPPYFSDDIPTLYKNIKEGKLKFPKNVSENAKSLIIGLLERDPKKRLGAKNVNDIKNHVFFKNIRWDKLFKMQLTPPHRPQIDDSDGSDDQLDIIKNNKNNNFTDYDYDDSSKKVNRLINFSFSRNGQ